MKKAFLWIVAFVTAGFITACSLCVFTLNSSQPVSAFESEGLKVVIDAGHGGIDGGVSGVGTGAKESDINLQIALKLHEKCTDSGFSSVLTRKTQEGLYGVATKGFKKRDMERRKEIILEEKPSLVLSVHQH